MIRLLDPLKCRIYRRVLLSVVFLLFMIICTPVFSQTCVPVVNTDIDVNGIVVGTAVLGGGGLPAGCFTDPGWAGVISHNFSLISGSPGYYPALFMAGYNAVEDATLDKLYIGVHVEDDPDFDLDDRLILYFDADNSGAWDAADFALVFETGPVAPPFDENCNHDPESVTFYRHSGTAWTPQSIPPGSIERKTSFDYDNINDAEVGIWELEIGLDLSVLGLNVPSSGAGLKVGARLYVEEEGIGSIPWCWPAGLTTVANPLLWDPNEGNVTPGDLEEIIFDDCADVIFDPDGTSGISATDAYGNNNKFTLYEVGDFNGDGTLDSSKRNNFTASVKFYNPSDPGDNSPVAIPNTGDVRFYIKPWNGGFLGEYLMNTSQVEFDQLNQVRFVQFDWPATQAQYNVAKADLDASSTEHACLKVELDGFNVNMHESNDVHNRNLTYTTLSTVKDRFLISARGMKEPEGSPVNFVLRLGTKNIPRSLMHPDLQRSTRIAKKTKKGAAVLIPGDDNQGNPGYDEPVDVYDDWNVTFPNAREIGLKPLGNGYFMLPMKVGQDKYIDIEITGGEMPVDSDEYLLSPRAGGTLMPTPGGEPPLDISVSPGKMVTILASGLINVNPTVQEVKNNGPNGFLLEQAKGKSFLLPADYYEPAENIGAVIASFDDFKTAFVIGADASFVVPENITKVSLAVNDIDGEFEENSGRGFKLHVIITDPQFLPTSLANPGHPALGIPAQPQVGANLPQVRINAYQLIPVVDYGGEKTNILRPTGYVAYAVYKTHPQEGVGIFGTKKTRFELTLPFAYWTIFHDDLVLEDGLVLGGKLGYMLTPRIVLELEGGVGSTTDRFKEKGWWLQFMGNIRLHLRPLQVRRWSPYLTAGAGYFIFRGLTVDDETFALQGGIGAMLPISSSFGLRFDSRVLRLGDLFGVSNTTNFQVGGGLVFWF